MKPYGLEKNLKGWKKDHHIHENNKKIGNWWEDANNILPRATLKLNTKKEIKELVNEE